MLLALESFTVTGVEFIPGLVDKTIENAAQRGMRIEGLEQEISELDVSTCSYDMVWLATARGEAAADRLGLAAGRRAPRQHRVRPRLFV
jgi:hypothetical protein